MSDDNENEQPLNLDIPDHLEYHDPKSEEHGITVGWLGRPFAVDRLKAAIIGITEYAADQLGEPCVRGSA